MSIDATTKRLKQELNNIQEGSIPKNKYTDVITKFASGYYEIAIPDFLTPKMKAELKFFHKEMIKDGGVDLTLNQLAKYSHIYNKRADHARYLYSCFITYERWIKEYEKDLLLHKMLNGEFPKQYTTKEAKRLYVIKENKELFGIIMVIINTVNSLLYMFADEGKRTDRELTTINRMMESKLITQRGTENRHR